MIDPNIYDPYERYAPTVPLEVAKMQLGLASFAKAALGKLATLKVCCYMSVLTPLVD
jgi:hypothetical protein